MNPRGWMLSPGKTLHPVYILDQSSHHDFRPQNHLPSFSNYPTPSPSPSPYATYPPTPQIYENSMSGMSHQNGVPSQLVSPISGYQHSYSTPDSRYQIPHSTTWVDTTPQYIVQPPLAHVSIGSAGTMADSCGIAELKETIEKVNSELNQLRTKISELNAKVREQEECLSAAQTEMSNLREENAQAQTEMSNLREENAQAQTEISNLREENTQAQTEMSNLREENAQAQTEMSNLREENAQAQTEMSNLREENAQAQTEMSNLREENAQAQTEISNLREENTHAQTEMSNLREENAQAQTEISNLREEKAQAQTEISNLREENVQAQTEISNLREENAQLASSLKEVQGRAGDRIQKLEQQLTEKETELIRVQDCQDKAGDRIQKLEQKLTEKETELIRVQDCQDRAGDRIQKLEQQLTEKEAERIMVQGRAGDRIQKLEQQLTEKETELIRVQGRDGDRIQKLEQQLTKKEAELIRVQGRAGDRIQKLKQQLTEKEAELIRVQDCQDRAGDRIQKLEQQLTEKETELIRVQDCQGRAEDRIQKLEQQLREKETELIRSEEKCWVVQERLDLAEKKLAQFLEKTVTAAEECLAQISFPLVEKDGNTGGVKYDSNIKHLLKRKKPDEETKENNVKTIKLTSILEGGSKTKKKLKLSKRKEKSCLSNPHLICNKKVVIRLERLNDSTVAEMTACGSALPPKQVNESNDDASGINSLPDEIIEEIFGYFTQNQLGQIARACKRWNVLTKSPVLWRKVNVKIFSSDTEKNAVAESFLNGLPSCVTFMRLDFAGYDYLDFEELCVRLHQNCPHLEELIMINLKMSYLLTEVINFCTQFLQCVKKLAFHNCRFYDSSRRVELNDNSKIEGLDLYHCSISHFTKKQFSKLLHLKELRLANTTVNDTWFEDDTSFLNQLHVLDVAWTSITLNTFLAIQRHGHNLKELYLCSYNLQDYHLTFTESAFPRLQIICLSHTRVTCEGVVSLIQSCPSLENVYVDKDVAESFAAHPFVVTNRCKSGIVKAIDWIHNHKVDYSHK